jgi:hypothetical protein
MNHFVELKVVNDGIEKNFIGRIWCEYSSKKVRKEVVTEEVVNLVAKELNVSTVDINWHPEKYQDSFNYLIEKYDESIHDILFPETNEDVWVERKVVETDR